MATGVIITKPPPKTERSFKAEQRANSGLIIKRAVGQVLSCHRPVLVIQEANAGSRTASSAAALARAQQACVDAVDDVLGARVVFVSQRAVKVAAVGSVSATKGEVEAAMRKAWPADWEALLKKPSLYAQRPPPRGKWDNAFDAMAVVHAAWDHPSVGALRHGH